MDGRKKIVYFLSVLIVSLSTFTACKVSKYSGVSLYVVDNPYTELEVSSFTDTLVMHEAKKIAINNVPTAPQQAIIDSIASVKKEIRNLLLTQFDSLVYISKSLDAQRNANLSKVVSTQKNVINNVLKVKNDSIALLKQQLKAFKAPKVVALKSDSLKKTIVAKKDSVSLIKKDSVILKTPKAIVPEKIVLKSDSLNKTIVAKKDSVTLIKKDSVILKTSKIIATEKVAPKSESLKQVQVLKKDTSTQIKLDTGLVKASKIVAPIKVVSTKDTLKKIVPLKKDSLLDNKKKLVSPLAGVTLKDTLKKPLIEKIDSVSLLKKELEILKAAKITKASPTPAPKVNQEVSVKTDSILLLKKQLETFKAAQNNVKTTPTTSSIKPVVNSDKVKSDSIKTLLTQVKQLESDKSKVKSITPNESVINQKSDSIRSLKWEIDKLKQVKSTTPVASKPALREVMVPIVVSTPVSPSPISYADNQSSSFAPHIQQNQANIYELTKDLETLKSKYNDLEDIQLIDKIVPVVIKKEENLNQKSDSIKFLLSKLDDLQASKLQEETTKPSNDAVPKLKNKADSIQFYLNKIEALKSRKSASDSIKLQSEQLNKLTSKYQKSLVAKEDSIKKLAMQLKSAKKNLKTIELADLRDTVLFVAYYDSGSLSPNNKSEVMTEMKTALESNKVAKVQLAGFTDISGSPKINQKLSAQRVNLVKQDLLSIGYNEKHIFMQAWGSKYASSEKNENERRVEIMILLKK